MGEVTDYITGVDEPARTLLERLRVRTLALVPDAEEGKSYGMAALRYRGRPLISVVAAKHGYSLFPFSSEIVERATAGLPGFESTKGGIRFTDAADPGRCVRPHRSRPSRPDRHNPGQTLVR